jgi:hypothetical protein
MHQLPRSLLVALVGLTWSATAAMALQPGQAQPKRLYSNGDSITRAFRRRLSCR